MVRSEAQTNERRPSERGPAALGELAKPKVRLATKLAIPVALATSLVILLIGVAVYRAMAEGLVAEKDSQGIFAARLAAVPEIDSWDARYNTVGDLQRRLVAINAALTAAGGSFDPGNTTGTLTKEQEGLRRDLQDYDAAQEKYNRRRLATLLSEGALDVWVIAGENELRASASGRPELSYTNPSGYVYRHHWSPETDVFLGSYGGAKDGSGVWQDARFFRHPIVDRTGKKVGYATVVFSERGLNDALSRLKKEIIGYCILGVLAATAAAYFVGRHMTSPLSTLLQDIRQVADGDFRHRTIPRTKDEIGVLATSFDQMTRNLAAAESLREDLAEKEHEVSVAHEVQERLFPKRLPELAGLKLDAANSLASDLSTDLFDVVTLPDGQVGILVMTASGRGVPAAIVLSMARALFRARAMEYRSAAEALKAINQLLSPDLRRGMFVTAAYAIIDPETGEGTLVAPGHRVPALHWIAATQGLRKITTGGIALGLDKGPVFDRSITEANFVLAPGDRLVLASEGAVSIGGDSEAALGEEGYCRLVLGHAKRGQTSADILASLKERAADGEVQNDITLVQALRPA